MAKYGTFKYGEMPYGDLTLWIYHRTQSDITNNTVLAYVNYWDLNRIETRMQELSDKLNNYSYMQNIQSKTDWSKQTNMSDLSNIPTLLELSRLRSNMIELINSFFVYTTTPALPETFEYLDVNGMNHIEKILRDLHYMTKDMELHFRECDTFYCGED